MTYTIVTPTVNTNSSYKDTGRLSFYRYEDLQVLAELYAQANACIACDAKSDARGGLNQQLLYTTKWVYLGNDSWGLPNYLAPQKKYLDWERITNLVDGQICELPQLGNTKNTSWLYTEDPFGSYSPYMHEEPLLSGAGTTAGTKALFGDCIDLNTDDVATALGLNRPFFPNRWTDPRDIVKMYEDAKTWSNLDLNVLTWNQNLTRNNSYGQAFDQTWTYTYNRRERRTIRQNGASPYDDFTQLVDSGWSNPVFETRRYWTKRSDNTYSDGSHDPTGYLHYAWESQVDSLTNNSGNPSLERNVPIPTSNFGSECLQGRKVMFVWKTTQRDVVTRTSGSDTDVTTVKYFSFIADL